MGAKRPKEVLKWQRIHDVFSENRLCSYLVVLKLDHAMLRPLGSRVVFRDIKRRLLILGIHRFSVTKKKSEFSIWGDLLRSVRFIRV